jgi:hypothetical protein
MRPVNADLAQIQTVHHSSRACFISKIIAPSASSGTQSTNLLPVTARNTALHYQ